MEITFSEILSNSIMNCEYSTPFMTKYLFQDDWNMKTKTQLSPLFQNIGKQCEKNNLRKPVHLEQRLKDFIEIAFKDVTGNKSGDDLDPLGSLRSFGCTTITRSSMPGVCGLMSASLCLSSLRMKKVNSDLCGHY